MPPSPATSSSFGTAYPDPFTIDSLTAELNTAMSDLEIGDKQLSGGQNIVPASNTSIQKRDGMTLFGPFLGNLPITGGFNFVTASGTQRQLVCYNTGVNIHTSTTSTAISGITLTQGLMCDGVYFPFTDKFYITNGTDTVARIANDGTGDQTSTLQKGKYITQFQNRILVANTSAHPDYVYYTDLQLDTYTNSAVQWFQVVGAITGIITYFTKVLIFTKRKIYRLENFTFDGTNSWASALFELPVEFGSIVEGTIKVVNGFVYFLGQDMNNVAAVYQCDGYSATNISDAKVRATAKTLVGSLLTSAAATSDGMDYRIYAAETGQTNNTLGLIYDSIRTYFYPVERKWINGVADFSTLWSSETSGVWYVYAGTQSRGQVYQLHSNAGLFDEIPEESYVVTGNADLAVDANPAKRVAEGFKLSQYGSSITNIPVTQVAVQVKKNAGTTTGLTLRIETDASGVPSGTLASASATATLAAITTTSYGTYAMFVFATAPQLTGSTPYHAVVEHTTEGSGNSQYFVNSNTAGNYANGNTSTYASGTWTKVASSNLDFVIYTQAPIDAYADTKAYLPVAGKECKITKFQSIFSQIGNYFVEIGIELSTLAGIFQTYLVNLNPNGVGGKWDDNVSKWDDGVTVWDGTPSRSLGWTDIGAFVNRTIKIRIRNRNANNQFEFNKIYLQILERLRNV